MQAIAAIIDEIALEGLEGITLPILWMRIDQRQPKIDLTLDDAAKEYIWQKLASLPCGIIDYFIVPHARTYSTLDDNLNQCSTNQCLMDKESSWHRENDPYPYNLISDETNGIRGSCRDYYTRDKITSIIRNENNTANTSFQEATAMWGDKLVLVANQQVRDRALFGTGNNPSFFNLTADQFCLLERIGRARWRGETQRILAKYFLKLDFKNIFRKLKFLWRLKLITHQTSHVKLKSSSVIRSNLLLLSRFHTLQQHNTRESNKVKMCSYLEQLPDKIASHNDVRNHLGLARTTYRKVCQALIANGFIDIISNKRKSTPQSYIRLLKSYQCSVESDSNASTEDDSDNDMAHSGSVSAPNIEEPMLQQVYNMIYNESYNGISKLDLLKKIRLKSADIRVIIKRLLNRNFITEISKSSGKQRKLLYVAKVLEESSSLYQKVANEVKKTREYSNKMDQLDTCIRKSKEPPTLIDTSAQGNGQEIGNVIFVKQIVENSKRVGYRSLKRQNMILEWLNEKKCVHVDNYYEILRSIRNTERDEGLKEVCDYRSIKRLISKLTKEGTVKVIDKTATCSNGSTTVSFLCSPDIEMDDELLNNLVIQYSLKMEKDAIGKQNKSLPKQDVVELSVAQQSENTILPKREPDVQLEHNPHCFLFLTDMIDSMWTMDNVVDDEVGPEESWRRSLSAYKGKVTLDDGWINLETILNVTPLSVLCKLVSFRYNIEGLEEYLGDSKTADTLFYRLPIKLREQLEPNRLHVWKYLDTLNMLCKMGLLSSTENGPNSRKSNAQFRVSDTGYFIDTSSRSNDYSCKSYKLESFRSVVRFWRDLQSVCLSTDIDKLTKVEDGLTNQYKVRDNLLGNGKGAGGLDSGFFSHLVRNWKIATTSFEASLQSEIEIDQSYFYPKIRRLKSLSKIENNNLSKIKRLAKLNEGIHGSHLLENKKGDQVSSSTAVSTSSQAITKSAEVISKKRKKNFGITKDDKLLKKRKNLYTREEEDMILICQAVKIGLRQIGVAIGSWSFIRDEIERLLPYAASRTSEMLRHRYDKLIKNQECMRKLDKYVNETVNVNSDYISNAKLTPEEKFRSSVKYLLNGSGQYQRDELLPPSNIMEGIPDGYDVQSSVTESYPAALAPKIKNVADITRGILQQLLMASLSLKGEQYNSNDIYRLLHTFPSADLENAFEDLKQRGLIKKFRSRDRASETLATFGKQYAMSHRYDRRLSHKIPLTIFSSAQVISSLLLTVSSGNNNYYKFPLHLNGVELACLLSLLTREFISIKLALPQQIICLNAQSDDSTVYTQKKTLYVGNNEVSNENLLVCVEKEIVTENEGVGESSFAIRNTTTYDNLLLNSCDIQCRIKQQNFREDQITGEGISEDMLSFRNEITTSAIQPCDTNIGMKLLGQKFSYGEALLSLVKNILNIVRKTNSIGITIKDLKAKLTPCNDDYVHTLDEVLRDLINLEMVYMIGFTEKRIVANDFIKPWSFRIINSDETDNKGICSDTENLSKLFIGKPWYNARGQMVKDTILQYEQSILLYILTNPGVTKMKIIDRFKDVIHDSVILDILEALLGSSCIHREMYAQPTKITLFSCPEDSMLRPVSTSLHCMDTNDDYHIYFPMENCLDIFTSRGQ
ncbi:General transcription factor 3C polypeptide 1 [Trichoplax sp. H2]|nr:General transcription factor 3C polypeptide 1 [Trichoplax sp. H2]|eukprot:RDD40570.1 General transcription factor 3C polypeptide 1 [Trichoplax sp. H2]